MSNAQEIAVGTLRTERLSFAEIDICDSLSAEVFVIITNAPLPECILPWRVSVADAPPKFTTHVCQSASSHAYLQSEVEFTLSKCLRRSTPDDTRYRYFGIGAKEGAAVLGYQGAIAIPAPRSSPDLSQVVELTKDL